MTFEGTEYRHKRRYCLSLKIFLWSEPTEKIQIKKGLALKLPCFLLRGELTVCLQVLRSTTCSSRWWLPLVNCIERGRTSVASLLCLQQVAVLYKGDISGLVHALYISLKPHTNFLDHRHLLKVSAGRVSSVCAHSVTGAQTRSLVTQKDTFT